MYVVMIASECAPVAKVGGLGDVVFGLSRELEIRGHSVEIILPKYDCMRYDQIWGLQVNYENLWVPWYGGHIHCTVWFGFVHGRKCFFIEPHSADNFFNRGAYYGFPDEAHAVRLLLPRRRWSSCSRPASGPTSSTPTTGRRRWCRCCCSRSTAGLGMGDQRVCHTIHNFKHQGVVGESVLWATGLGRPGYYCDARPDGRRLRPRRDQPHQGRAASTRTSSPPSRRTTPGKRATPSRAAASATRCTCTSASSAASSTASTTRCGTRRSTR